MPDDEHTPPSPPVTRRDALRAGALGLTLGLAGCSTLDPRNIGPSDPTSTPKDWEPPDNTETPISGKQPDTDAATFNGPNSGEYSMYAPATFGGPDNIGYDNALGHPDTTTTSVEITQTTATITFSKVSVARSVEVNLYIQPKNGNWVRRTATLDPTEDADQSASTPPFETRTIQFDLSDTTLETHVGGSTYVSIRDPQGSTPVTRAERYMKTHNFIGIPYDGPNGSSVHWVNNEEFNPTVQGGSVTRAKSPNGLHETIDHNNGDTTVFLGVYTTDEFWGAATTVTKSQRNSNATIDKTQQYLNRIRDKNELPYFETLAREIRTALQKLGKWNDPNDRYNATTFFFQAVQYAKNSPGHYRSPTIALLEGKGDCSDQTFLFLATIRRPPFNAKGAYVLTKFNGGEHMVGAINIEEFGYDSESEAPDDWYILSFSQAKQEQLDAPADARYVFCELSGTLAPLGGYNPSVYSDTVLWDNLTLDLHPELRN